MFANWLNLPARISQLEKGLTTMAQEILAEIEALKQKAIAESAQVAALEAEKDAANVRIDELSEELAELKAIVEAGLGKSEILAALDTLGTHIEGIYTPTAEGDDGPPTDELQPGFEVIDPAVTDDTSGVELGDVPEPPADGVTV